MNNMDEMSSKKLPFLPLYWWDGYWRIVGKFPTSNDHNFAGWLPVFTPIEEDANG